MARVLVALIVGAALGATVFLFLRQEEPPSAASLKMQAVEPVEVRSRHAASRTFVSVTQPGLLVTVTRSGAPETQARVELSRAVRSMITTKIVWEPAGKETTDGQGRAEFPASSGRYHVSVTASDGERAVEAVEVSWGATPTFVTLAMKPAVLFGGQVLDAETRRPLPSALVRADPQPEPEDLDATIVTASTQTDSLGRFGLQLPSRPWRLEARAPGYVSNAVAAKEPSKDLVIELTRGAELLGVVVDVMGSPIADAALRITPGDVASLATDREGRFVLTVPKGSVSLHALAPDGRQGLSRVTIGAKDQTARTRIVVAEGAALTGLVRDERGPVGHADVRIVAEPESLEVAAFETANDGRFTAKGLPQGRYSVRAQQGLGRRATAVGLELPGAAPVELVLSSSGRLRGVVTDGVGTPIEGAEVALRWPKGLGEVRRRARTGADGHFEFDDLLPAEVFVQAQYSDLISAEVATYVAPGSTAAVTLVTALQGRLVGTVTGPQIERVLVRGERAGGDTVEVDKLSRRFEKLLSPGVYYVHPLVGLPAGRESTFLETQTVLIHAGQTTTVVLDLTGALDASTSTHLMLHPELGSGLSFENSPGGVRVDFLMSDCPAAKAGVQLGDLIVAIDGETTRDALDAFARVRKPADGASLDFQVRRNGQDLTLTLR